MEIYYKEDWPRAEEKFRIWWNGGVVDRPLIQITAPRKKPICNIAPQRPPEGMKKVDLLWFLLEWVHACNVTENWSEPDFVLNSWEVYFSQTYFGGESFPQIWLNLGPGIITSYLTDFIHFDGRTAWFGLPVPLEWKEILELKFAPDNKWWRLTKMLCTSLTKSSKGKFIMGMPDLGGPFDILSSLRGTENLLLDLIKHPDEVKEAAVLLLELWFKYYNELYEIFQTGMEGSSVWMGIWAPGRWYPTQCDFAAMISPEMFEEFIVPNLQEQCRRLDYTIYHLDGPGQIAHLEHLLSIPELGGIQWVPGAGNPGADSPRWFSLYRKVQKKNRRLVLSVAEEKVEGVLGELSSRGLLIGTSSVSEDGAKELVRRVQSR